MAKVSLSDLSEQRAALSARQVKNLNATLSVIDEALQDCDDAESVGHDCSAYREQLEHLRQQANAIKAKYAPHLP